MARGYPLSRLAVTVQARGLAAEEARLTFDVSSPGSFFRKKLFELKIAALRSIESDVYNARLWPVPLEVTAVSDALRQYLIDSFSADPTTVVVDNFDQVALIKKEQVAAWREELRGFFKMPHGAIVYGYSGSCKQWQCAEETVAFMAKKIEEDPRAYGVILSTDVVPFQALISQLSCDQSRFLIRYVPPKDVVKWLSVCDYGVLLRYEDVVNWVSRPTKALEYLAVGLSVIHNNTVKWLIDYDAQTGGISGSEITPQPKHCEPS